MNALCVHMGLFMAFYGFFGFDLAFRGIVAYVAFVEFVLPFLPLLAQKILLPDLFLPYSFGLVLFYWKTFVCEHFFKNANNSNVSHSVCLSVSCEL